VVADLLRGELLGVENSRQCLLRSVSRGEGAGDFESVAYSPPGRHLRGVQTCADVDGYLVCGPRDSAVRPAEPRALQSGASGQSGMSDPSAVLTSPQRTRAGWEGIAGRRDGCAVTELGGTEQVATCLLHGGQEAQHAHVEYGSSSSSTHIEAASNP
jgi:hypothetical protein